ncbi:NADH-quinone oxidoreductase subunit J [Parasulfuritortus cantonensis]|uniref:NADH-quinone oxidoreductase subunit J n=1 Tax=Parasulfuritortus cantonensis TaxID=2528202 RepID=A0A4R1BNR9_9PROT|nr:proton-conducting transporter membrane subunit [Parasulfuritortus cantonensis]TCJ18925.1 NADH-quinone oxidoreductase subunit J [Parasulfuritortus cantonensis]
MNALVLPVVLPLLTAFLLQPAGRLSAALARWAGPAVLLVCAGLLVQIALLTGGEPVTAAIGGFAPPVGIVFYADALALLMAIAVPVSALLLWPRAEAGEAGVRQSALMLLLVGSGTGMALSGDLFNLYVFYELLTVASFGLASATGTGRAYVATVRYVLVSGFGSLIALAGIALLYAQTGSLNLAQLADLAPERLANPLGLAAFACLLIGFGVKAELFPVNNWVPDLYACAGKPISALLAGVVSKLAVLVLLRLTVLVFDSPEAREMLMVLGLAGLVTGELAAWRARDLPRLLAYSSIGQLGLLFVALSLPGPAGLAAALAVALHHLLVKPALFMLAERWHGSLDKLAGAGRASPLAAGLFTLFALSLVGVPPLPGFWAKLLVLLELARGAGPFDLTALALVLAVTVVEAHYLFRLVGILYSPGEFRDRHSPRALAVAGLGGAVLVAAMLTLPAVSDALAGLASQAADTAAYRTLTLGGGL